MPDLHFMTSTVISWWAFLMTTLRLKVFKVLFQHVSTTKLPDKRHHAI